jgi:hypothetical protein
VFTPINAATGYWWDLQDSFIFAINKLAAHPRIYWATGLFDT